MADGTYQPKTYHRQGGDEFVVADGGVINLETGGKIQTNGTDVITSFTLEGGVAVAADALVIPVNVAYVAKTTGNDAEALTLANGVPGQMLTISLVADGGGDGTLTPASSSGWATIVFADAGDTITLRYLGATSGWIIVGGTGVAAPPVITI